MKGKIWRYIEPVYSLGSITFGIWIVYWVISGIMAYFKPHKERLPRVEGLVTEAFQYKDSVYVISKRLDTVYYHHQEEEIDPEDRRP